MITILTVDGIKHGPIAVVNGTLELAAYSSSLATQNAIQTAYDAGDWEDYTPPELEPAPPEPNWQDFRLALLQSTSFRDWSERLPATWREDLKLAAIAANSEALQSIYDLLAQQHTPEYEAAVEWQAIADANYIGITF